MQVQVRVLNDKDSISAVKAAVSTVDKSVINGDNCVMECLIVPDTYREVDKLVTKTLKGDIEVLQLSVRLVEECALTDRHEELPEVSFDKPPAFESKKKLAENKKEEGFTSNTAPGVVFPDRNALREHMKSDWHKFNLKRKTQGQDMLTEDQYKEAMVDADFLGN